jgi:hypothetical protein
LTWSDRATSDSYDSTEPLDLDGRPRINPALGGGDVGTNGSLYMHPLSAVNGALSTPWENSNSNWCAGGGPSAKWLGRPIQAVITGPVIRLAGSLAVSVPPVPDPAPEFSEDREVNDVERLPPGNYGNLTLTDSANLHLTAGTYNINSLNSTGAPNAQITIDAIDSRPVIINVVGQARTEPLVLESRLNLNPAKPFNPRQLLINYAGPGAITVRNTRFVGQINAPNAVVTIDSEYFGSVVGSRVTLAPGARLHFARNLRATPTFTVGPAMLTSFSWKKY